MNSSDRDQLLLRRRRRFLLQLLGGSSGLLLPQLAWAGRTVQAVRSSASDTHTRFVLDLDGPVDHRVFTLEGPDRAVLDLTGTRLAQSSGNVVPDASVVRSVRYGIRNGQDLRVVFDLSGKVVPRVLQLPPGEGAGHRLVVDFPHAGVPVVARSEPVRPDESGSTFRDLVIAIDPGHGGKDPGAVGPGGTREKDIVLQISRRLRDMVLGERGLKPVMIRDSDTFISLRRRTEIAREHKADLFVSVHADAFHRQSARGASVYCLSLRGASSEAARWLARRENAADFVGGASIAHQDEVVASVLL
ncbi:MAG: N-acetylmuramoyl-L-alanine amidase, partial [Halothiobacillaceae bacterium]